MIPPLKNMNVRLPPHIINLAKSLAYAEGKTLQEWIERLIESAEIKKTK